MTPSDAVVGKMKVSHECFYYRLSALARALVNEELHSCVSPRVQAIGRRRTCHQFRSQGGAQTVGDPHTPISFERLSVGVSGVPPTLLCMRGVKSNNAEG
jgi:hypothetical protein